MSVSRDVGVLLLSVIKQSLRNAIHLSGSSRLFSANDVVVRTVVSYNQNSIGPLKSTLASCIGEAS